MLHRLLKRLGLINSIVVVTFASVAVSVGITILVSFPVHGQIDGSALLIALLVPGVVAPIIGGLQLHLIFELDRAREQMHVLAITDTLTRAFSRRFFFEELERAWASMLRTHEPLAVMLLDVDDFKSINDTYGHQVGDQALVHLSDTCRQDLRRGDLFARYGGEEFVVLLPATHAADAEMVAQRLCERLAKTPLFFQSSEIRITISIGIAVANLSIQHADALILAADEALYRAKNDGKNRIIVV